MKKKDKIEAKSVGRVLRVLQSKALLETPGLQNHKDPDLFMPRANTGRPCNPVGIKGTSGEVNVMKRLQCHTSLKPVFSSSDLYKVKITLLTLRGIT